MTRTLAQATAELTLIRTIPRFFS